MRVIVALNITFKSKKLEKCCNCYNDACRQWGDQYARKIFMRLNELRAATMLSEVSYLPPTRLHDIDGIRKGCFAVDVIHPARMIFKINHEPVPKNDDGGINRSLVTDIIIWEVEDYHGKRK